MRLSLFVASLTAALLAAQAAASDPARVTFDYKPGFDIERKPQPGDAPLTAQTGDIVYSEMSKGFEVSFLQTRFFESSLLSADLEVTTDEPLVATTLDGTPWLCTLRTIGKMTNAFLCFGDTNGDGRVDQWRRLNGKRGFAFVRASDLTPADPEPLKPESDIRKGRAKPATGDEAVVEVRYAGLVGGNVVFRATARLVNEQTPFAESETSVALAGATTVSIKHPIERIDMSRFRGFLNQRAPGATNLPPEPTEQSAVIEVTKATEKSVTFKLKKPFIDWRYWRATEADGKSMQHTLWGGANPDDTPIDEARPYPSKPSKTN